MRHATEPRYYPSRNAYYTRVGSKQIPLAQGPKGGETLERAWVRFREVHAAQLRGEPDPELYSILQEFLTWTKEGRAEGTYKVRAFYLASFHEHFGKKQVSKLRKHHLDSWLAAHPTWGDTAKAMAADSLKAALGWAFDREIITRNPLAGYKKMRGAAARVTLITSEEHLAIVTKFDARTKSDFARLLEVLWETGARPGELAKAEAFHVDLTRRTITLEQHKTRRKTGRKRIIYLSPRAAELVAGQIAAHPTGPLFPNERGRPYKDTLLANKFAVARDALGLPEHITAYSYRHTFATDWLKAGKPVAVLAELLGTSIAMIQQHYGHLAEHAGLLQAAVDGFAGGR